MRENAIQRLLDFPLDRLCEDEANPDCLFIDFLAQAIGVEGTEYVTCYIHDEPTATYDDIIGRLIQLLKVPYEKPTTLSQLKAENAKLRDENARLLSCLTDDAENARQILGESRALQDENAKLRELVRAYQEVAEYPICRLYDERKPDPFSGACAECDGESCLIQCLNDELRELGVEVE